jgi:hypothetical protein
MESCDVCAKIYSALHSPASERIERELGRICDVLSNGCSAHHAVVYWAWVKHVKHYDREAVGKSLSTCKKSKVILGFTKYGLRTCVSFFFKSVLLERQRRQIPLMFISGLGSDKELTPAFPPGPNSTPISYISSSLPGLELVHRSDQQGHMGRGRLLDPSWIDEGLIRRWKERCFKEHGDACEKPNPCHGLEPVTPLWLIDVERMCLVPGDDSKGRYVTLSYVWGQVTVLRTTKAVLEDLRRESALKEKKYASLLPATVRDAIHVTSYCGERYLWVDAICIVQDSDSSTLDNELSRMAAIYATSVLTLIAGDGDDAQHGLRGLRGSTEPRALFQDTIPFGKHQLVKENNQLSFSTNTYYHRAWTFQEYIFSKRRLLFQDGIVRWKCTTATWHEDLIFREGADRPLAGYMDAHKSLFEPLPSLSSIADLVCEFNKKKLTYPEDIMPSTAGLLTTLSHSYLGGFLFGMPELYFDVALLWLPEKPGAKRKKSSGKSSSMAAPAHLPSWSWMGWDMDLEFKLKQVWKQQCFEAHRESGNYIVPILNWFTMRTPDSRPEDRRRIRSEWFDYKCRSRVPGKPLPSGWSRHQTILDADGKERAKDRIRQSESGQPYFTHDAFPERQFLYPLPIPPPNSSRTMPEQTPYLYTMTSSISLFADGKRKESFNNTTNIRTSDERWVGILSVHSDEEFAEMGYAPAPGTEIDLVAISRGFCWGSARSEMLLGEYEPKGITLGETDTYDYWIVLYVKWENGVAYRRGLGYVLSDVWEKETEGKEPIELILG